MQTASCMRTAVINLAFCAQQARSVGSFSRALRMLARQLGWVGAKKPSLRKHPASFVGQWTAMAYLFKLRVRSTASGSGHWMLVGRGQVAGLSR